MDFEQARSVVRVAGRRLGRAHVSRSVESLFVLDVFPISAMVASTVWSIAAKSAARSRYVRVNFQFF